MFSNTKKEAGKAKSSSILATSSHSLNSLVHGTLVEGSVHSESDIRVDGTIKGKLICQAKVIIGSTGHVEGEIRCKNAVIEGKFNGNLQVEELLHIRESAKIYGDVFTNKLVVQTGALFNVKCTMGGLKNAKNGIPDFNKEEKGKIVKETKPTGA